MESTFRPLHKFFSLLNCISNGSSQQNSNRQGPVRFFSGHTINDTDNLVLVKLCCQMRVSEKKHVFGQLVWSFQVILSCCASEQDVSRQYDHNCVRPFHGYICFGKLWVVLSSTTFMSHFWPSMDPPRHFPVSIAIVIIFDQWITPLLTSLTKDVSRNFFQRKPAFRSFWLYLKQISFWSWKSVIKSTFFKRRQISQLWKYQMNQMQH